MPYLQKPPATKRELLNRLLSADFNGDLRTLGKGARVSRVGPSVLEVRFDNIGRTFLLSAHIPREEGSKDDGMEFAVPLPQPTTRRKGSNQ
jgi:hypothetical protein